jgi:hypothetical protein
VVKLVFVVVGGLVLLGIGSVAAWKLADGDGRQGAFIERTSPLTVSRLEPSPRLRSPDGAYEVAVTDTGIVWRGQGGEIRITATGVSLKSSSALAVEGGGLVSVKGSVVNLCGSGGQPVARMGDLTNAMVVPTPPAGAPGQPVPGPIIEGSPTVFAC